VDKIATLGPLKRASGGIFRIKMKLMKAWKKFIIKYHCIYIAHIPIRYWFSWGPLKIISWHNPLNKWINIRTITAMTHLKTPKIWTLKKILIIQKSIWNTWNMGLYRCAVRKNVDIAGVFNTVYCKKNRKNSCPIHQCYTLY